MGIRKSHPAAQRSQPDPNRPHAFKGPSDHWLGGGVPPSSMTFDNPAAAIGTGLQFADRHCAVCRREASDPIHAPADAD
jgi:hypothetical protein